ncbi:hypothetical protein, partial [Acidithiobacillus ferrooxidans]|uniref:hypothetical protein n=1 Tax=Acidithiobacillus ferrooxidans TaxID=920 RepID=UPI001941D304
ADIRVYQFVYSQQTIPIRIIHHPEYGLAAREMENYMVHTMYEYQFFHYTKHGIQMSIHFAFGTNFRIGHIRYERVSFKPPGMPGLFVYFACLRQVPQSKIRTNEAEKYAVSVTHKLNGGQRRP